MSGSFRPFSIRKVVLATGLAPMALWAAAPDQSGDADQRVSYSLSAGATHTDNAGRTSINTQSGTSADAGLAASIVRRRERSAITLRADLTYREYLGEYGGQLAGGLAADTTYRFTPYFSWTAEENLSHSLVIAQNPGAPDNTQVVNLFGTGPDLRLPLSQSTSASLQGRWSHASYSKSDFDNSRLSATVGLQQRLGPHSSVSLNGSTSRVSYNSLPSSRDFDTRSAFVGWSATGAHTTLNATAGYSWMDEGLGLSSGGATYSLGVTRRVTARSTLSLDAGRSFGDAADALRRDQVIGGVSPDDLPGFVSTGPTRSDYVTAGLSIPGERSTFSLSGSWRREAQRDDSFDRDSLRASVGLSRRVNQRLSVNFSSNYTREQFDATSIRFNEWATGVGLSWALSPAISATADYSRVVGDGDTNLGADTRDYTANSISARLIWSPRP